MERIPVCLPPVTHHAYIAADDLSEQIPSSLQRYNVPKLWEQSRGKGVLIGVCDTGLDLKHNDSGDLKGAVKHARDFTNSRNGWQDLQGHSTHVLGTIGGRQGNGMGVAGVAPDSDLIVAKGLNDEGMGDDRSMSQAIIWLVDQGCHFINVSAGAPMFSQAIADAVKYAASKGCLVIAAAGNNGSDIGFPARMDEAISVSAVDDDGRLADFSSRGPQNDIAAPGVKILSCYKNGSYAVLSGTSMACPFVVGILALAKSAGVKFDGTALQCRKWISSVSVDVGAPGDDPHFGVGLFDPTKLIVKAETPAKPVESDEHIIDFGLIFKKALGLDIPLKGVAHYPAKEGDMISLSLKAD